MSRIGIGIPAFGMVAPEVMFDYMRMVYNFGRRYPEHDFFIIAKTKSEQFRARNSIVGTAIQFGLNYLLFLDDDHIFDWNKLPDHSSYEFLHRLLEHDKDIVGCLYYHRTGEFKPVLMKEIDGGYTFLRDDEITGELQQVDVQGGGCMLIKMKVFDKIPHPWFEPEQQTDGTSLGTDIQLCKKAKEAGFEVWCDTNIVIGHLKTDREVITPRNRNYYIMENVNQDGFVSEWMMEKWLREYMEAGIEYTGLSRREVISRALDYDKNHNSKFTTFENPDDYYKSIGKDQLCRQICYHSRPKVVTEALTIIKAFKFGYRGHGLDFGCGSAPVGFELLRRGHQMDFVDIDGAYAFEFLKWRIKNHPKYESMLRDNAKFELVGPYDFVLMLDSIEHLYDWEPLLDNIIGRMKEGSAFMTNFFSNVDYRNPEHVNMNHNAVSEFLVSRELYPKTESIWIKSTKQMGARNTKNDKQAEVEQDDGHNS